ncbi:hypothetical protein SCHPADRAFT_991779 [Schizopora paradoxa]|uniref:Autophagy-related protein 14 n=1 Tax=Schizopora paradoxa TaxID=27342 RepID=A0A0H2S9A8_9AGAM|nr:hypothetical protein SCHPADRAFT_991779 [Schizopora paradoxa]
MQTQSDDEGGAESDFMEGASSWQPEQRAIRHLQSIQVRNFTPFPARDTFASTLLRAPNVPALSASVDDTDAALSRRRSRKISAGSAMALRHFPLEGHDNTDVDATPRARKRTSSKVSVSAAPLSSTPSSATRRLSIPGSASATPTIRRGRPRTTSQSSTFETSAAQAKATPEQTSSTSSAIYASDSYSSQKDLEEIIWSRLIPTFLTIERPHQSLGHPPHGIRPFASHSPNGAPLDAQTEKRNSQTLVAPAKDKARSSIFPIQRDLANRRAESPSSRVRHLVKSQSPDTGSRLNGSASPAASPKKMGFPRSPPLTPPLSQSEPTAPIYMSSFHRPSTNPIFDIETDSMGLSHATDLSAGQIRVQLWGQAEGGSNKSVESEKGKGVVKHPESDEKWKVFCTWDVDLSELIPLPDELEAYPSKLPSNTLLVNYVDSRSTFYLPHSLLGASPEDSLPQSPDYNSDTEVTLHSRKPIPSLFIPARRRTFKKDLTTSSYQDLVKLVSLQGVISDTQISLEDVVHNCDKLLEIDTCTTLRRDVAEREYHLRKLQEQRDLLDDNISSAQDEIRHRKELLQRRRQLLAEARALHENDLLTEFQKGSVMAEERHRISSLTSQIAPMRTSLLSTLAYIFPIELLSPPDLLFTILSVPLPIPVTGTDPAPPLSLAAHSEVTEDGVATALGYAALLVHLMATYLCRLLTYPITFVGSRSLIKDPISAMVGPRMFPLYSKGVDTYRFEYAVFLLNKNIELLMADRDLRALDMRQTLPNLKNLLLTLTSGEVTAHPRSLRPLPSPSIASGLQTPTESSEPLTMDTSPPPLDLSADAETALTSACSTPKQTSSSLPSSSSLGEDEDEGEEKPNAPTGGIGSTAASRLQSVASIARRPKVYLGFAPLTSMFRRSASSSGKSAVSTSETNGHAEPGHSQIPSDVSSGSGSEAGSSASASTEESEGSTYSDEDVEDDRRTIRGVSAPVTPVEGPNFRIGNGKGPNEEKLKGGGEDGDESAVDAVAVFVST